MKKPFAFWALVVSLFAAACGGNVDSGGSGGSGAGGGGKACLPIGGCDSTTSCELECNSCVCDTSTGSWECTTMACVDGGPPPGCPAIPPEGQACGAPGLSCQYYDGCESCFCSASGQWACSAAGSGTGGGGGYDCAPPPPPACPAALPQSGTYCPVNGQVCTDNGYCAPSCTCEANVWQCLYPPCPEPVCPPAPPPSGTSCPMEGQVCGAYGYCSPTCTCVNGAWTCVEPNCPAQDGGSAGGAP